METHGDTKRLGTNRKGIFAQYGALTWDGREQDGTVARDGGHGESPVSLTLNENHLLHFWSISSQPASLSRREHNVSLCLSLTLARPSLSHMHA